MFQAEFIFGVKKKEKDEKHGERVRVREKENCPAGFLSSFSSV